MIDNAPTEYDRDAARYALVVGPIGGLAYLASNWPALELWHIVAATTLTSIMILEVYLVVAVLFRLLFLKVDEHFVEPPALERDQE